MTDLELQRALDVVVNLESSPRLPVRHLLLDPSNGNGATLTDLLGRTITSCRFIANCAGSIPLDGTPFYGAAFLLEVDDGALKLAVTPDGSGFKFVLFNAAGLPK